MVIELHVLQFWSEIILVISNRTPAVPWFNFEITWMISDQIALIWIWLVSNPLGRESCTSFLHLQQVYSVYYNFLITHLKRWRLRGRESKNLVHFYSILIVSNYAWLLIYPKMSSWELINTMMTAILISPRSIALAMGEMQNMHSTQFNYHYLSLFVCIQNHVSYRGFLHLTLCLSTCF